MAQPFGVGDVVGGRYRITHHVVTSADQDIVFQAVDQVLNRDVSVLLASPANAKQVATSARELATGDRKSEVQVLDLGLSADRTYLISTLTHPNDLLDLVVPDAAPYVEPFFTDSLGQELFGQSRVMEPETYADDEEYYAELQDHLAESDDIPEEEAEDAGTRFRRGRPAFLSRVSDSINRRLRTDRDADRRLAGEAQDAAGSPDPDAAAAAGVLAGTSGGALDDLEVVDSRAAADTDESFAAEAAAGDDAEPSGPASDAGSPDAGTSADAAAFATEDDAVAGAGDDGRARDGAGAVGDVDALEQQARDEEVIDDPPAAPATAPPADLQSVPVAARVEQDRPSFTGLITPIGREEGAQDEAAAAGVSAAGAGAAAAAGGSAGADGDAEEPEPSEEAERSGGAGRWVALAALAALVLVGAVAAFLQLRGAEGPESQAGADSSAEESTEGSGDASPSEQASESAAESPSGSSSPSEAAEPEPLALSGVTREVPDSPGLNAETDGELPNLIDDDPSSTWTTFNYGSAAFGGFASQLDLVVELEESAEVTAVTLTQQTDTEGGSFEVLVGDSASGEGATSVGSGTWNWNDTTIELEEPAEGQYVIIRTTELPLQTSPSNAELPYSLAVGDIEVEGR